MDYLSIKTKPLVAFVVLTIFQLVLSFLLNYILMDDSLYYDFLGSKLSYDRINELIQESKKWKWLLYVGIPIFLLVKFFLITLCFSMGAMIIGSENCFEKFFQATVTSEFVFLIPLIIKLFWFSVYKTSYTLQDLQYFLPVSVFSLFNPQEVEFWLAYPLQLLNLFELLYWCLLAYQLKEVLGKSLAGSFGFVASTYGVGLLIWVVLVMFLTVSLS